MDAWQGISRDVREGLWRVERFVDEAYVAPGKLPGALIQVWRRGELAGRCSLPALLAPMHPLPSPPSAVESSWCSSRIAFPTTTKEADMLSPHEIAALLLLGDSQEIDDLEPEHLNTLLVHKLVTFEHGHDRGDAYPRLTNQGHSMLEAVRRIR